MLKNNVLWPPARRFKSRTEWEPLGFFAEALCNSTSFDLKLGFFSSSAINVLSDGFAVFLYNGGHMRMVINDILSEEDAGAIMVAESDSTLSYFDLSDIEATKATLSERDKHFFECLAWLIRNERLEIRIITTKSEIGIAHSKCGVFSDGLNRVGFDGSCNFSRTALVNNIESLTAFCDWDGPSDLAKINDIAEDIEITLSGKDDTIVYLDVTQVRDHILSDFEEKSINSLLEKEAELISKRLESQLTDSLAAVLLRSRQNINRLIERIQKVGTGQKNELVLPSFPFDEPRDYQMKAYEAWKSNKQKGLFAMATGTGKTLTALNCLLHIYQKYNFYKAVILVPTVTLVEQWDKECQKFHFSNIVKVSSKNPRWKSDLDSIKLKEQFHPQGEEPSFIIISTYASFARETIFHELVDFSKSTCRQILLIADEAHNMGAGRIFDRLEGVKFLRRIGLSATPERQFDEKGNRAIMQFFGSQESYTFQYTMQEAIDNGFLCRYKYFPHIVHLTDEEMIEYIRISNQLAKYYNYNNESFPSSPDDILLRLLLKRKRIIHKAKNKEQVFRDIIRQRYEEKGDLRYTLVYVPEGTRPDIFSADVYDSADTLEDDDYSGKLIDTYTQIVQSVSSTTTVKKFISSVKDRDLILDRYANGEIEVLTSMKCLDEGVDVPRSEMAIFCASTGNPRQFIQRRGRILRTHKDKHMAYIHDLVVAPIINSVQESYVMERNLLRNELRRVRDFATMSENADYAYKHLEDILSYYELPLL